MAITPIRPTPPSPRIARGGCYEDVSSEYYDSHRHPTCANFRDASRAFLGPRIRRRLSKLARVLEVGAGKSSAAPIMIAAGYDLTRLIITDSSPGMLAYSASWQHHGAKLEVASAEGLPVEDRSVDLVVASMGDPYNQNPFWREMRRVLSPTGTILITMPAYRWAQRYRALEALANSDCAVFQTEHSLISLPSYPKPDRAQRQLVAAHGLQVVESVGVPLSCLQNAVSSKLQETLDPEEFVIVGYTIEDARKVGCCR